MYTRAHAGTHVCTHRHEHPVHIAHVCPWAPGQPRACPLLLPQWSYGFYLIHLQGKQGFQFFCKTEDMKRRWMEQFEMAM